jgi:hypothetical protein
MGAKSPDPIRRLVYCFSSGISPFQEEANAGLEEVPGLLEEARRQGIDVEEVDLSKQDEEKRRALYEQAAAAAVKEPLQDSRALRLPPARIRPPFRPGGAGPSGLSGRGAHPG